MSEPEIARRCVACGAAVRGRAKFCPQCGSDMGEAPTLNREMTPSRREHSRVSEFGVDAHDDSPPQRRDGEVLEAVPEENDETGEVSVADAAGGRFVMIAGLLCVLSLVILILSYTLR